MLKRIEPTDLLGGGLPLHSFGRLVNTDFWDNVFRSKASIAESDDD